MIRAYSGRGVWSSLPSGSFQSRCGARMHASTSRVLQRNVSDEPGEEGLEGV